ncbi:hypothetical protein F5888DRAFT_1894235 [Russula emetica]|nr:hypothetical protein F5888DRAFT_1894235 [Russula emetica]
MPESSHTGYGFTYPIGLFAILGAGSAPRLRRYKFGLPSINSRGMLLLVIIGFVDSGRGTHVISGGDRVTVEGFTPAGGYISKMKHARATSVPRMLSLVALNLPTLRTVAPSVGAFLKGCKGAWEHYLAENDSKKSDSELSESGKKTCEEYFEKTKGAWEVGLALVLNKLCKKFAGPFALGEQISIVDVHLAAWLHELDSVEMKLPMVPLERLSGLVTERPLGVGVTGFGAIEGHWRPPSAAGWCGGMGMPRTSEGSAQTKWER